MPVEDLSAGVHPRVRQNGSRPPARGAKRCSASARRRSSPASGVCTSNWARYAVTFGENRTRSNGGNAGAPAAAALTLRRYESGDSRDRRWRRDYSTARRHRTRRRARRSRSRPSTAEESRRRGRRDPGARRPRRAGSARRSRDSRTETMPSVSATGSGASTCAQSTSGTNAETIRSVISARPYRIAPPPRRASARAPRSCGSGSSRYGAVTRMRPPRSSRAAASRASSPAR